MKFTNRKPHLSLCFFLAHSKINNVLSLFTQSLKLFSARCVTAWKLIMFLSDLKISRRIFFFFLFRSPKDFAWLIRISFFRRCAMVCQTSAKKRIFWLHNVTSLRRKITFGGFRLHKKLQILIFVDIIIKETLITTSRGNFSFWAMKQPRVNEQLHFNENDS